MKKTVTFIIAADLIFILFLALASGTSGVLSSVLYYAAFLLPLTLYFSVMKKDEKGCGALTLSLKPEGLLLTLPVAAPLVGSVLALSAATSYLLSLVGKGSDETLTGGLFGLFILHALLPALLEEAVFRYIPLNLISPYSKKSAIFISAVLFALAHCNLAQMPYAFFAGLVFASLDLATGSILPSVLLHILNNTVSLFWQWDVTAEAFRFPAIIVIAALSVLSLIAVAIFRGRYAERLAFFGDKGDKLSFPREIFIFVLLTVFLAVSALF